MKFRFDALRLEFLLLELLLKVFLFTGELLDDGMEGFTHPTIHARVAVVGKRSPRLTAQTMYTFYLLDIGMLGRYSGRHPAQLYTARIRTQVRSMPSRSR